MTKMTRDFQPTDEPTPANPISEIKTEIETEEVTSAVTSDANQSQGQIRVEDIMMESRTEGDNLIGKISRFHTTQNH